MGFYPNVYGHSNDDEPVNLVANLRGWFFTPIPASEAQWWCFQERGPWVKLDDLLWFEIQKICQMGMGSKPSFGPQKGKVNMASKMTFVEF